MTPVALVMDRRAVGGKPVMPVMPVMPVATSCWELGSGPFWCSVSPIVRGHTLGFTRPTYHLPSQPTHNTLGERGYNWAK